MNKIIAFVSLIIFACCQAWAQPTIINVDPSQGYVGSEVIITGSGFGTNTADLVVWFGSTRGTVTSVEDKIIRATVPAGAYADNISVTVLSSGHSVQSPEKFFPVYSGSSFDPTALAAPVIFTDTRQLYDPCTCDLNGDGLPEVISTKFDNATNLLILQNQSSPESLSFSPITLNVGQPTVNIKCGDLNGDGKPDLYMSRGGTTRYNIFVLQNTSTGATISFSALQTLPMDTDVTSRRVTHRDLNGDGKPELIVTNSASGQVIIFENTSSGAITFNSTPLVVNVAGATSTTGLDVQDMDGDGKPDIVVCQFFGNDVFILRNTGIGTIEFDAAQALTLEGNSLLNLTTGDFNNDGKLEIAVVGNAADKVFVFINNSSAGNMSFANPQSFSVNDGPWGLTVGDVDGDGLLDIVATSVNQNLLAVLNNQTSGGTLAFTKKDIDLANRSRNVWVNDLDGDGKPDFAVATQDAAASNFTVRLVRNTNCYEPQFLNEEPVAVCPTQTVTLIVPEANAATFSWTKDGSPIAGSENTLDITTFGTYEVTATSESGGCIKTASINVADGTGTIPGNPTAGNDGPACVGGTLTLTANTVSGATYAWTGPNNYSSTEQNPVITNVTNDVAGVYSVTIQSGDCRSSQSSTTVEVVTLPEFSASATGSTTVCEGSTVSLSTQSRAGFTYQWLLDDNPIADATTNTFSATQTGSYSVLIDDDNSNCEINTNVIEVNIYTLPVADFSMVPSGCTGQEIVFTNSSTVDAAAPVEYNWTFGDGASATTLDASNTYTSANSYTVQLEVSYTGVAGCSDNASKGITITDPVVPTIESAETNICPGSELELGITGTFNSILWSTEETSNIIVINEPGTYAVEVSDVNGCSSSAEIVIGANPAPEVVIVADKETILAGDEVQLQATGAATYTWTPEISLDNPNINNPIATPEQTTTYIVTGVNAEGCSSTAEITITVTQGDGINVTPLKAFSPNSTINPTWTIENVASYPDCTMSIFDERGALVFRKKGYNNDWDATYEGGELPEGVYYYVFGCESLKPKTGTVLVVR